MHRRDGFGLAALLGRRDTWALDHVEPVLAALADPRFARHVDTDGRSVDDVVETVAEHVDLRLERPRPGPVGRRCREIAVTARHIRL